MNSDEEKMFSGEVRPPNIPVHWLGEPLPSHAGWRWFNPQNRGDSVRLFRGNPQSAKSVEQYPYVIVTVDGNLIGRDGKPTGEQLHD